jgi:hypothetical protein
VLAERVKEEILVAVASPGKMWCKSAHSLVHVEIRRFKAGLKAAPRLKATTRLSTEQKEQKTRSGKPWSDKADAK